MLLEGSDDGDYYHNAGRVPWRQGVDALLSGDPVSGQQTQKLALWVKAAAGGDPQGIAPGYLLDATPIPSADYSPSSSPPRSESLRCSTPTIGILFTGGFESGDLAVRSRSVGALGTSTSGPAG